MTQSKERAELRNIRARALEDLKNTSDAELRQEYLDSGEDLVKTAAAMKAKLSDLAASSMREKIKASKSEAGARDEQAKSAPLIRPTLDMMKALIAKAFEREPTLAMAFRKGKNQSEEDIGTVYEDLVSMKLIDPADHGD